MSLNKVCFGISSKTEDNKHIVFVDSDITFDQYPEFLLMLKEMQQTYFLSDFYIIKTKNGFNAFTLDKLELDEITQILHNSELVDFEFIIHNYNRGYYTLRWGDDKKYLESIFSEHIVYLQSMAHYCFFSQILNLPLRYTNRYDALYDFDIIAYENTKHGWLTL